jgi:hypothetical protein
MPPEGGGLLAKLPNMSASSVVGVTARKGIGTGTAAAEGNSNDGPVASSAGSGVSIGGGLVAKLV